MIMMMYVVSRDPYESVMEIPCQIEEGGAVPVESVGGRPYIVGVSAFEDREDAVKARGRYRDAIVSLRCDEAQVLIDEARRLKEINIDG